jgi:hypothetical protein
MDNYHGYKEEDVSEACFYTAVILKETKIITKSPESQPVIRKPFLRDFKFGSPGKTI